MKIFKISSFCLSTFILGVFAACFINVAHADQNDLVYNIDQIEKRLCELNRDPKAAHRVAELMIVTTENGRHNFNGHGYFDMTDGQIRKAIDFAIRTDLYPESFFDGMELDFEPAANVYTWEQAVAVLMAWMESQEGTDFYKESLEKNLLILTGEKVIEPEGIVNDYVEQCLQGKDCKILEKK